MSPAIAAGSVLLLLLGLTALVALRPALVIRHGIARLVEAGHPVHRVAVGGDLVTHRGAQNRVVLDQQDSHGAPLVIPGLSCARRLTPC